MKKINSQPPPSPQMLFPPKPILGQSRAWSLLTSPHFLPPASPCLLWTGPAGVGKRTTARLWFKKLNHLALDAPPFHQHADYIELSAHQPGRWILDDIEILGSLRGLNPMEAAFRVVVIDDVDQFSDHVGNGLLKMLEEPPPRTFFVLLASDRMGVMPTLTSRSLEVRFAPLTSAITTQILSTLVESSKAERQPLSETSLEILKILFESHLHGIEHYQTPDGSHFLEFLAQGEDQSALDWALTQKESFFIEEYLRYKIIQIHRSSPTLERWTLGKQLRDLHLSLKKNVNKKLLSLMLRQLGI